MQVKVKKLDPEARIPEMTHKGDSGFDLYANESLTIKPGERKLVSTGLSIEMPKGIEAQVRPKSGLAIKNGISVLNTPGTVDSCYRGEIKVIAINLGQEAFTIEKGTKIAQMVFMKVECPKLIESRELDDTTRNAGGFGSTGLK